MGRLKKNKSALFSLIFIVFICLLGMLAEWISPYSFEEQNINSLLTPPNKKNWLGTDGLGRDLLSRIIYGSRVSMSVGILTALISCCIGGTYGIISGWVGGKVDAVMMRVLDFMFSLPSLVLMILIKVIFDSLKLFPNHLELRSLIGMVVALSIVSWSLLARVIRGQVLQIKKMTYIEAALVLGLPTFTIILKHVIPNILGPVLVLLTLQIPANILAESFLSFIGLGLQPPFSSWGVLAQEGWENIRSYPHLIASPGFVLFTTLLSFQVLGDGLKDAFDPKMKNFL